VRRQQHEQQGKRREQARNHADAAEAAAGATQGLRGQINRGATSRHCGVPVEHCGLRLKSPKICKLAGEFKKRITRRSNRAVGAVI
jgi:hypothetical protein